MLDEAFLPGGDFPCNVLDGVAKTSHWYGFTTKEITRAYMMPSFTRVGHSYILVEVLRLSVPNASSRGLDGLQMCYVARSCHNLLLAPVHAEAEGPWAFLAAWMAQLRGKGSHGGM
jgi:hypothetical protein